MSSSSRIDAPGEAPLSDEDKKERAREKARLRKRAYDQRARAAGEDGAGPRRGVVLHLSEAARSVLKNNRERRRLAGLPPMLDSQLVESLLLDHAAQSGLTPTSQHLLVDQTRSTPQIEDLLSKMQQLKREAEASRYKRLLAEERVQDLEQELKDEKENTQFCTPAVDWDEVERLLLTVSRLVGPGWRESSPEQFISDLVYKARILGYE